MTPTEAVIQVMQEHPSRDALDIHIMRCEIDGKVAALVPIQETVQILRDMLNAGQVRGKMRNDKILYSLVERTVKPVDLQAVKPESEPEKMYLVCVACGEAFDSIETADKHYDDENCPGEGDHEYTIKPESEAM